MALPVDDQLGLPVKATAAVAAEVALLANVALAVDDQLRLPTEAAPALLTGVVPRGWSHAPGVTECTGLPGILQRLLSTPGGQRRGLSTLPASVRPVVDDEH